MPFDDLKKKLGYTDGDAYVQAPINIPGTEGLDPSASPTSFLGQMLGKTIGTGDDTKTLDSVQPESSPIDLLAGSLGSRLGSALASDAGSVVGNDIGAINLGKVTNPALEEEPLGTITTKDLPKPTPDGTVTHQPNDQMHLGEIKVLPSEVTQRLGSVKYSDYDSKFKKLVDKLKGNK